MFHVIASVMTSSVMTYVSCHRVSDVFIRDDCHRSVTGLDLRGCRLGGGDLARLSQLLLESPTLTDLQVTPL